MDKAKKRKEGQKIEILSPAGSYACFRAALNAGADAVYAGGTRFGARAYADNFTEEELIRAIREAHLLDRKLYLTVNTLLKDREIEELYDYLLPLYENGLDAVIVQDAGVLEYVRHCFPEMDIHASTQMTVTDLWGAKFLEGQGVSRVVPARELSLEEIRRIRMGTGLEIECFVHGALCYCYSGQCLLSSMIGGRSGNRGQCAQPCRLPYTAGREKKYFLSPKDICTLELIPEMIGAGIDSFKIEGRMKKPEYVAAVTAMYRKYTDLYVEKGRERFRVVREDREKLMDLYNRGGSSVGYYLVHNGREMMALDKPNHAGVPAVEVISQKGREVCGRALTDLHHGDVIGIAGGRTDYTLGGDTEKGKTLTFLVPRKMQIKRGEILSRIRNTSLLEEIDRKYVNASAQKKIDGYLTLSVGSPAVLTVTDGIISAAAFTEENVQKAERSPLREEQVRARMMKTGNTPFTFNSLEIYIDEDVFLPMQQLGSLRRDALEKLEKEMCAQFYRNSACPPEPPADDPSGEDGESSEVMISVLAETPEQLNALVHCAADRKSNRIGRVYPDSLMTDDFFENEKIASDLLELKSAGVQVYPALPRIFRAEMTEWFEQAVCAARRLPVDGFLIRNYESFSFLRKHGFDKTVILDHNLYVFNKYGKKFWEKLNVSTYTAPVELNAGELGTLGIRGGELVAAGCLPVMVSAQCLRKNVSGCKKQNGSMKLTDRYGNSFLTKNYCRPCYNVIYNTVPLWLGGEMGRIHRLGPAYLRIQLTEESPEQTCAVIRSLAEQMDGGRGCAEKDMHRDDGGKYTLGHFNRGII